MTVRVCTCSTGRRLTPRRHAPGPWHQRWCACWEGVRPASLSEPRRRPRPDRIRDARLFLLGAALGLLLSWLAGQAAPAFAAGAERYPPLPRLAQLYPDLQARTAEDPQGFTWHRFAHRAHSRWRAQHPAAERARAYRLEADRHRAAFMCIARHESHLTWDIATGNGYYGGLQMDRSFQMTYGPELYRSKGTADRWTRDEQIAVASRAVPSRGFSPWPNTGRMCGLLPAVSPPPEGAPLVASFGRAGLQNLADRTHAWLEAVLRRPVPRRAVTVDRELTAHGYAGVYDPADGGIRLAPDTALSLTRRLNDLDAARVLIHEELHTDGDVGCPLVAAEGAVDAVALDLQLAWAARFLPRWAVLWPASASYPREVRAVRRWSVATTGSRAGSRAARLARRDLLALNCSDRAKVLTPYAEAADLAAGLYAVNPAVKNRATPVVRRIVSRAIRAMGVTPTAPWVLRVVPPSTATLGVYVTVPAAGPPGWTCRTFSASLWGCTIRRTVEGIRVGGSVQVSGGVAWIVVRGEG